jgi:branched-chain amino acid transport system permease protein
MSELTERSLPERADNTVTRSTPATRIAGAVLAVAALAMAALPFVIGIGSLFVLINLFVYVVLAVTWNLLAGFGGMVSIGQQAYLGIGAYGIVVLADRLGLDPFLAIGASALAAAIVAVPVSLLAFRLAGGYFAIGTWVIAEVVRLVVVQSDAVGAGAGTSVRALAGADRALRVATTYWWALAVAAAVVLGAYLLVRSRLGIAITAIRDDATAAASNGVPVVRVKRIVFVLAAAGAAAAGSLLALSTLRVQPDSIFGVQWSAFMIFMVVIGGVGTLEGPILGAIVFFALQQWLAGYDTVYLMVLGAVAVAVVLFAPRGLWGLLAGDRRRVFAVGHIVRGRS